jgi:VanZ family protein
MKSFINKISAKRSISIIIFVAIAIIIYGVYPKNSAIINNVQFIKNQFGIRFGANGIAFAQLDLNSNKKIDPFIEQFSIEMVVRPIEFELTDFQSILSINDSQFKEQFVIGQYMALLICMNGDDYDNSKMTPRIVVNDIFTQNQTIFLTIASDGKESSIYINGKLVRLRNDLSFEFPNKKNDVVIVLGNTANGQKDWRGDFLGLAIYEYALGKKDVSKNYLKWSQHKNTYFDKKNAILSYSFKEKTKNLFINSSDKKYKLIVPHIFHSIKTDFFNFHHTKSYKKNILIKDIAFNYFGFFIPGFIFSLLVFRIVQHLNFSILLAVILSLLTSLSIEIIQSVIPSRISHIQDLALNLAGGISGAVAYAILFHDKLYKKRKY